MKIYNTLTRKKEEFQPLEEGKVKHKSFGPGVITAIEVTNIVANFDKVGEKKLGYEVCMKNNLLQFI